MKKAPLLIQPSRNLLYLCSVGALSLFLILNQTFPTLLPDEAGRHKALYGLSGDFIELHIPLVIWHKQHMELHKLNTWQSRHHVSVSSDRWIWPLHSQFSGFTDNFPFLESIPSPPLHTLQLAGLLSSGYLTDSQDSSIVTSDRQQCSSRLLQLYLQEVLQFLCAMQAWTAK